MRAVAIGVILLILGAGCKARHDGESAAHPAGGAVLAAGLTTSSPATSRGAAEASPFLVFRGMSDASAGVALDDRTILVGDDETDALRVYNLDAPGLPVSTYDPAPFLHVDPAKPELDIEAATRVGDRVYWTGSHGRNKNGKLRESRNRFFATTFITKDGRVTIKPVGTPCSTLTERLAQDENLKDLNLAAAIGSAWSKGKNQAELAPKAEGLNIEGVAASPDGRTLYFGLRNPGHPDKALGYTRAIVIPLTNLTEVIDKGATPAFGQPLLWNLGGRGIRDMTWSAYHKAFFIIAGPAGRGRRFALYRWSGRPEDQPVRDKPLEFGSSRFTPEVVIAFIASPRLLLLSDDGDLRVRVAGPGDCLPGRYSSDGLIESKYLVDLNKRQFRGLWLEP